MRQLFKGENYSREETIRGNTVFIQHHDSVNTLYINISHENKNAPP